MGAALWAILILVGVILLLYFYMFLLPVLVYFLLWIGPTLLIMWVGIVMGANVGGILGGLIILVAVGIAILFFFMLRDSGLGDDICEWFGILP